MLRYIFLMKILPRDTKYEIDQFYLRRAQTISFWSKDPSTKVGAVIVDRELDLIIGAGYNKFPDYIQEDEKRMNNRDVKYDLIIHAEMCALMSSMYNYKDYLARSIIYTYPIPPCIRCMSHLVDRGIRGVVSLDEYPDRWAESIQKSKNLINEVGGSWLLYPRSIL